MRKGKQRRMETIYALRDPGQLGDMLPPASANQGHARETVKTNSTTEVAPGSYLAPSITSLHKLFDH